MPEAILTSLPTSHLVLTRAKPTSVRNSPHLLYTDHFNVLHSLLSNSRTSMSTAMTFFLSMLIHSKDTPILMNELGSNEPFVQ